MERNNANVYRCLLVNVYKAMSWLVVYVQKEKETRKQHETDGNFQKFSQIFIECVILKLHLTCRV